MKRTAARIASLWTGMLLGGAAWAASSDALPIDAADHPGVAVPGFAARHARLLLADPSDRALAEETLQVVVPLADRLGFPGWRAALEDQAFAVLDPRGLDAVRQALGPPPDLGRMAAEVRHALSSDGRTATFSGRNKSLYGVAQKAARKGVPLTEVYDRTGLRLRFATVGECYEALDLLHHHFEPVTGEFDDYISQPKASGYQSLHTAVHLPGGVAEIQIRTDAQHQAADAGDAAHWRYKLGV